MSVLVNVAVITSPSFARVVVALLDASVIAPMTGATVSIVTAAAKLALLGLPAASTEFTTTAVLVALSPAATVYVAV